MWPQRYRSSNLDVYKDIEKGDQTIPNSTFQIWRSACIPVHVFFTSQNNNLSPTTKWSVRAECQLMSSGWRRHHGAIHGFYQQRAAEDHGGIRSRSAIVQMEWCWWATIENTFEDRTHVADSASQTFRHFLMRLLTGSLLYVGQSTILMIQWDSVLNYLCVTKICYMSINGISHLNMNGEKQVPKVMVVFINSQGEMCCASRHRSFYR